MKFIITYIFVFTTTALAYSQEELKKDLNNGLGLGFHLSQYHDDFGIGLNVTSPGFANDLITVRVRANYMYHEHLDINGEYTWTPYYNGSIGVAGGTRSLNKFLKMYGEGGIIYILPSDEFSTTTAVTGGYGLFGFEFFMDRYNNYFIEFGGVGTGARAEKETGRPMYSNGFTISVGYRLVL